MPKGDSSAGGVQPGRSRDGVKRHKTSHHREGFGSASSGKGVVPHHVSAKQQAMMDDAFAGRQQSMQQHSVLPAASRHSSHSSSPPAHSSLSPTPSPPASSTPPSHSHTLSHRPHAHHSLPTSASRRVSSSHSAPLSSSKSPTSSFSFSSPLHHRRQPSTASRQPSASPMHRRRHSPSPPAAAAAAAVEPPARLLPSDDEAGAPPLFDDDDFMGAAATAVPVSNRFAFELALYDGDKLEAANSVVAGDITSWAFQTGADFFVSGIRLPTVTSREKLVAVINRTRKKPMTTRRALNEVSRIQIRRLPQPSDPQVFVEGTLEEQGAVLSHEPIFKLLEKTEGCMGTVRVERSLRRDVYYVFSGQYYTLVGAVVPNARFQVAFDDVCQIYPILKTNPDWWDQLKLYEYLAASIRLRELSNVSSMHVNEKNKEELRNTLGTLLRHMQATIPALKRSLLK